MSYGIRHLYSPVWAPHSCVFYKQQALRECLSDWRNLQSRYPTPVLGPAAHPGPRPDRASFSCRHPGRNSGWGGAGQAWVQGHIRFISIPTHFWLLPGGPRGGGLSHWMPGPGLPVSPPAWVPAAKQLSRLRPHKSCDLGYNDLATLCLSFPSVHFTMLW